MLLGITKASLATDSSVRRIFPRDHTCPHRGCSYWKARLSPWIKRKCGCGAFDPAGTGLAYHEARKAGYLRDSESEVSLSDVEAVSEALNEEITEESQSS